MKTLFHAFLIAAASFGLVGGAAVQADVKDPATGISFPETASFSEGGKTYNLDLTGVATRKKFFIKVYSIASYLQSPIKGEMQPVMEQIFDSTKAKQLTLIWARSVDTAKIKGAYNEAFKGDLPGDKYAALQPQIDEFLGYFSQDSKKGDNYTLRWAPGGILTVLINDKNVGQIKNDEFAAAVWKIWFANDDVVKRQDLLQRVIN